ncbi:MAG: hypothetical protein ABFS35_10865 [Bacteroidota bacterium]
MKKNSLSLIAKNYYMVFAAISILLTSCLKDGNETYVLPEEIVSIMFR